MSANRLVTIVKETQVQASSVRLCGAGTGSGVVIS